MSNEPKPHPAKAAYESWLRLNPTPKFPYYTPQELERAVRLMTARAENAHDNGWHAAMRHLGVKR